MYSVIDSLFVRTEENHCPFT